MSGREKTPRRTTRRTTATPVRDVSPPARNLGAASTALEGTPTTRRSARATSRKADQPRSAMNNNALPEIQTRQSYAYGSSKTPLLPEQLHVRDSLTMKQVADQMNTAINQAGQNLNTHAAELEESRQHRGHSETNGQPKAGRGSKERSPASETTDVQKKQRTAQWAKSLEGDQLQNIEEEEEEEDEDEDDEDDDEEIEEDDEEQNVETPETHRTEPSSFPSGIFDHSYQYERGLRGPRKPTRVTEKNTTTGSRLHKALDRIISITILTEGVVREGFRSLGHWTGRVSNSISKSFSELPDSPIFFLLTKAFMILSFIGFVSYTFCFTYTHLLCTPNSSSIVSKAFSSLCGNCQTTMISPSYFNLSSTSEGDMTKITSALQQIDAQIRVIENRLNSRLDTKISSVTTDVESLRKEQDALLHQLEDISNRASLRHTQASASSLEIASPLLPKINYFSPANGAVVNPHYTSPTRETPMSLPWRIMTRMVGLQKYDLNGPVTALEPWQDVGECWCAAATTPGQDSIRLGIGIKEPIYPTELVVEHPPREISVMPETAPKQIELWADFGHLTPKQWKELNVDSMQQLQQDPTRRKRGRGGPFSMKSTYALLATVEYDLSSSSGSGGHIQRFKLDVNQLDQLQYPARDFVVRVRSTHGGRYGCLYRLRLHGVPVAVQETT